MEATIEGLYASAPVRLPFAPSLDIRAFLLRRGGSNLLVYSVPTLESDAPEIERLGGISRQYLNHRHEAMFASSWVAAPLFLPCQGARLGRRDPSRAGRVLEAPDARR